MRDRLSDRASGGSPGARGWLQGALLGAAVAMLLLLPSVAHAHEPPLRVAVQSYIRADGQTLRMLVRVPVESMRDVEFPLRGAGYLDLARADSTLRDAAKLWVADAVTIYANGSALPTGIISAVRASLPSDQGFESYAAAVATLTGARLPTTVDIPVQQAMLDVLLTFSLPVGNPSLAIDARFAHLGIRTSTVLRVVQSDGTERPFLYDGDQGVMPLEPGWWHAASHFARMGFTHLFGGLDHLLFLLCLIIPIRRIRPLVGIVTAFAIAHSLTLAASALGYAPTALWFPPLVELLIAVSIVYLAIENILGANVQRRWVMAFAFGLVHGFAFSNALAGSLQFAGGHLITALAAFNLGIEAAQLLALAVAVPLIAALFRRIAAERAAVVVASALVAHMSWHWMLDRYAVLRQYRFTWPALDAAFAMGAMQVTMGVLITGGILWVVSGVMTRLTAPAARGSAPTVVLLFGVSMLALSPTTASAQSASISTMSGVYSAEQAVKGREVFMGSCTGCHTVASHSGSVFAARWMRKPLSDFYEYVSHLMPKSAPGTLSEDEYVWVTAYVLKLNGMPAGTRELSAEPTVLQRIRIDSSQTSTNSKPARDVPQGARIR